jgi:hypothetical protein
MRQLKLFEEFLKEEIVKKVSINKERSKSMIKESERKMLSLKEQLEKIGIKNENANDYVEYCYDIILYLIRAKLYLEGYSASGMGAHEAEVSFLRNLGFSGKEVQLMDQMRYFRNGILYYGTSLDKEYADKVVEFTRKAYSKLKKLMN